MHISIVHFNYVFYWSIQCYSSFFLKKEVILVRSFNLNFIKKVKCILKLITPRQDWGVLMVSQGESKILQEIWWWRWCWEDSWEEVYASRSIVYMKVTAPLPQWSPPPPPFSDSHYPHRNTKLTGPSWGLQKYSHIGLGNC